MLFSEIFFGLRLSFRLLLLQVGQQRIGFVRCSGRLGCFRLSSFGVSGYFRSAVCRSSIGQHFGEYIIGSNQVLVNLRQLIGFPEFQVGTTL